MQSTQLACPHCGSTLNFGVEITAGTTVECLICMRTFAASNPITVEVEPPPSSASKPKASVEKAKPTSVAEVLVAKPYVAPTAAIEPPESSSPVLSIRRPSSLSTNVALCAVAIGLLFLLTGGIVLTAWQFTAGLRDTKIASNLAGDSKDTKIILADDKNPENGGGKPLGANDEDDDDIRAKFQEEIKQVLKRKAPSKTEAADPDWDAGGFDAPRQGIVGLDQQKINLAIDMGVAFLKKSQNPNGSWNHGHTVGHAALGGLTLLECKIAPGDPAVLRAAAFVRSNSVNLVATYELSLAILFLDRLGDRRDRPLIQGMALRLMAGQNDAGGWTYNCSKLTPQEMVQLFSFLRTKESMQTAIANKDLLQTGIAKKDPLQTAITNPKSGDPASFSDPFRELDSLLTRGVEAGNPKDDPKAEPKVDPKVDPKAPMNPKQPVVMIRPEALNPNLKMLPVVQNKGKGKGKLTVARHGAGDNSNTQFATLALWAARRHGVPTDQALLASYQRFVGSQNADHGWGYHVGTGSTNTMTCVGLLGLGIGHGTSPEVVGVDPKNPKAVVVKPALEDAKIQNGLQALARTIGQPSLDPNKTNFPMENLYFLWSVERVAMLYDLKTIGGKDWYGWGAQGLVHNQRGDGAWPHSQFPGTNPSVNTCFALLFLKRSNLVQDLTNNLRLNTGVRDPQ
jgi:hypothetical protein